MTPDELAAHLYTAWRERMEVLEPVGFRIWEEGGHRQMPAMKRPFRPKWHNLTTSEQQVWQHVAKVAHLMLAEVAR